MRILFGIILAAGIAWLILYLVRYFNAKENKKEVKCSKFQVGASVFLFILGLFLLISTATIPAGHRGVPIWLGGKVEERVIGEGLTIITPFFESVVNVDVRVQAHEFKSIDAASKEMQTVKLTGNVNWHFDPAYVNWIYQNIGASTEFVDKILDKSLQDFLKEVTPTYPISSILDKRSEIRSNAVRVLSENLGRYHIIINDIYIADIQFSVEYLAAIEKQQVAQRQILTEQNILEQIKIKAEQANAQAIGEANANATKAEGQKRAAILTAEGSAQSAIIQAEGNAKAITTVADAQAKANEVVNKTLTEQIIQYALVQKIGDDIKVVILPSGQQFILGPEVLGK